MGQHAFAEVPSVPSGHVAPGSIILMKKLENVGYFVAGAPQSSTSVSVSSMPDSGAEAANEAMGSSVASVPRRDTVVGKPFTSLTEASIFTLTLLVPVSSARKCI